MRVPALRCLFTVSALLASFAGPTFAAPPAAATIEISKSEVLAPVNPDVLRGFNFGNWMQLAEFGDDMREIAPLNLRFPAGNIGDEFDLNATVLDLLKTNLSLIGNPALTMQTRVFQGKPGEVAHNQPEDAAEAVQLTRERGLKVPVWEIGNEPDLYSVTRGDPSWTADRYCDVFRAQAAAIHAVDPDAKIAGPAVSGALPARDHFVADFIARCGDIVDILTWHIYPTEGERSDADALATVSEVQRTLKQFHELWADPQRNPLGHARKIGFGVTEYGLSWRTDRPRHIADQIGGLWATEVALRLSEGGAHFAHYFALQGTGGHGLVDIGGFRRASWHGFRVLKPLTGEHLAAKSSDAALWVHAIRNGSRIDLVVINPDAAAHPLDLKIAGMQLLGGMSFDTQTVEDEKPDHPVASRTREFKLPPHSVTHLRYATR
jgi:hypothetical protein